MILLSAEYLKGKGENIIYEFEDVEKYLKLCEKYQPNNFKIDNPFLINELIEDLVLFEYEEVYIFFQIKNVEEKQSLYIYDYADLDYKIKDLKENYAKIKSIDLLKLLHFQLRKN